MRIRMIDPAAYTPPYDHALCSALAAAGEQVELLTSRFRHGERPAPEGYELREHFHRLGGPLASRAAQHPYDMLRLRRLPRSDVTHFQWLPMPNVDRRLLPHGPVVLTAHDVIPREPRPGQLGALKATYNAVDAVIVHSEHGRGLLTGRLGVASERVHVIGHGVFDYLTRVPDAKPLPAELAAADRPVVLCFGLWRPYKGFDLMIDAFAESDADAELWIVGMPRMPERTLRERADAAGISERVRFVPRFVGDSELGAYFKRADVVALPYREIDQSGVLFTALAFEKPLLVTRVGGFGEIADVHGAAEIVPPNDSSALAAALTRLLADQARRRELSAAARVLATGELAWPAIARRTAALYRELAQRREAARPR
ncbi:MAG: glycosyltransferase family 4 protein [Solirubrobacterales bacterium]